MGWIKTDNGNGWTPPPIEQVYNKGVAKTAFNGKTLTVLFNGKRFKSTYLKEPDSGWSASIISLTATVVDPNGVGKIYKYSVGNDSFDIELSCTGEYKITFTLKYSVDTTLLFISSWLAFFAVNPEERLLPCTIKNVIDRVLSVTPTRTVNGLNKYTFRNNAEDYATEESPEFIFTGKHLFEVMLDIASYKKMFPALYKDEIYFRPFWNGETLTSDDLPPTTKAVLCSAIDQYCTALDSYVENMVCINDSQMGTVVEPYKRGYISTRSGNGSEISEDTAIIPTQSPIYQSIAMEIGPINGKEIGDIQSYIYEQEEYDSLSDTAASYPCSKGYALKFNRFEKNYTELAHRIKTSSAIASSLTRPALANIVGSSVGTNLLTYIVGLLGISNGSSFADLLFQPTYIPVVNARVRQYKPMFSEEDYEATLFYNQQSEVVDSEAFGEHVKGLVQKLGNHTEIRVYRFEKIDDVPTVGTLIDEKSVYDVAMTIYENHVDVTLCLVDYAELSTYIGVKNEIKTSDISATKWCNRFINWEEYFVFTHNDESGNALSVPDKYYNGFKTVLSGLISFTEANPLTCAYSVFSDENGNRIQGVFAPIKHLAIGNSIYFQWEMLDNFAAGYKSEKAPEGATNAFTGTQYNRAQKAVRYCDNYGRAEKMSFVLSPEGPNSNNSSFFLDENIFEWYLNESDKKIYWILREQVNCLISLEFWIEDGWIRDESTDEYIPTQFKYLSIEPNETEGEIDISEWEGINRGVTLHSFKLNSYSDLYEPYIRAKIAHEYPLIPKGLSYSPENIDGAFKLSNLLIKKDSAEALKFAAQYHFRQDWRDFIIGSGMSNFCSLVGGCCAELKIFISKRPINRFERHIKFDSENYLILTKLPLFKESMEKRRVVIELPDKTDESIESINGYDTIPNPKSWGLVGVDRNGNHQLIFGENKNSKNEDFKTTIYLVAKKKNDYVG